MFNPTKHHDSLCRDTNMISRKPKSRSGRAFTLIEILVVIGIISLLLAIMLPSLARARDQARRIKVRALIRAVDAGLELFHNDFGHYPSSDIGNDSIKDYPGANPDNDGMWGAHWLARALWGPDGQGVDVGGVLSENPYHYYPKPEFTMDQVREMPRVGPYIEGLKVRKDNDPTWGEGDRHPPAGRPFVIDDAYEFPLLYYAASPRRPKPFSAGGDDAVYCLWDNFGLTGIEDDYGPRGFWDFARTGRNLGCHPIGEFGSLVPGRVNNPARCAGFGRTFVGMLHEENVLRAAGVVRPVNPERFVVIHPGADAIWGTDDDIANFE